ncbi:MAG TPA: HD domain-containing protein [Bacilli bacterium]|nr:HD domain-containing protein [Bacilli bacterium]
MNKKVDIYKKILDDIYIQNIFDKIADLEIIKPNEYGVAFHGRNHSLNVVRLLENIMNQLNYDEKKIEAGKIAAILHDIGCIKGKKNHTLESWKMAKKYLNKYNLEDEKIILNAIKNHSNCNYEDEIAVILCLADKLDIKSDRVGPGGYNVEGMRQLQYIHDIIVKVNKEKLSIKFFVSDKFDINEMNKFYFTTKVFESIESFCRIFNINKKVIYLNKKEWRWE